MMIARTVGGSDSGDRHGNKIDFRLRVQPAELLRGCCRFPPANCSEELCRWAAAELCTSNTGSTPLGASS